MATTGYFTDDFPKHPRAPLKKNSVGNVVGATYAQGSPFSPDEYYLSFTPTSYVKATAFPEISPLKSFTISAWVNVQDKTANRNIFSNANSATDRFSCSFLTSQAIRATLDNGSPTNSVSKVNTLQVDGQWGHITIVSRLGTLDLYINGVSSGNGIAGNSIVSGTRFTIGVQNNLSGQPMNGFIRDVRVWDRALGDTEILEVYKGNNVFFGLIGWYRLDEGSGTEAVNYAGREEFKSGDYGIRGMEKEQTFTNKEFGARAMSHLKR